MLMDTVGRGNQRLTEIQCNTMARLNPLGIWERWSCTDHLFRRMSHRALLFSGDNIMVSQTVELGGKMLHVSGILILLHGGPPLLLDRWLHCGIDTLLVDSS